MDVKNTRREEDFDRLVFLLAAEPRHGWEEIFDAARKREVARIFRQPREPENEAERG